METNIKDNYMENYDIYSATIFHFARMVSRQRKRGKRLLSRASNLRRSVGGESSTPCPRRDRPDADKEIR